MAAGVAVVMLATPAAVAAQTGPHCAPGQPARFLFGIGELQERLGPLMGTPLECEHVDPATGATIQRTTTGLASFRATTNMPTFTDGSVYYALAHGQVWRWRGASEDLPQPSPTEAAYLAATATFRDRLGAMQAKLRGIQDLANSGQIDAVPSADLSALASDLWAARQAFLAARPSVRLDRYDQVEKLSLSQAYDAADLLLRGRLSESAAERDSLIRRADGLTGRSGRLYQQAREELSTVVPVVVEGMEPGAS